MERNLLSLSQCGQNRASEESGPGHLNSSAHATSSKDSNTLKVSGPRENASWLLCRAQTEKREPVRRLRLSRQERVDTGTEVEIRKSLLEDILGADLAVPTGRWSVCLTPSVIRAH